MSLDIGLEDEQKREELERAEWAFGDYDNGENGCPNCGRFRLCICGNGKHRCEKCSWCPEENKYVMFDWD